MEKIYVTRHELKDGGAEDENVATHKIQQNLLVLHLYFIFTLYAVQFS